MQEKKGMRIRAVEGGEGYVHTRGHPCFPRSFASFTQLPLSKSPKIPLSPEDPTFQNRHERTYVRKISTLEPLGFLVEKRGFPLPNTVLVSRNYYQYAINYYYYYYYFPGKVLRPGK